MFRSLHNSLLSLVYPEPCRICARLVENSLDGPACADCWTKTRIFSGGEMLCGKCGAYFGETAAPVPVFCHKCDGHHFDNAYSAGVYENGLAASVINLKTTPVIHKRVEGILTSAFERTGLASFDVLMPVPLSKHRRLERGFNQAELIASLLAKKFGIALDSFSLIRKTHTRIHRVGMDDKARELSVMNAFEAKRPKLIAGRSVVVIDDVLTSGSTASYCAKVLKKSGASRVAIFTLARAVLDK